MPLRAVPAEAGVPIGSKPYAPLGGKCKRGVRAPPPASTDAWFRGPRGPRCRPEAGAPSRICREGNWRDAPAGLRRVVPAEAGVPSRYAISRNLGGKCERGGRPPLSQKRQRESELACVCERGLMVQTRTTQCGEFRFEARSAGRSADGALRLQGFVIFSDPVQWPRPPADQRAVPKQGFEP